MKGFSSKEARYLVIGVATILILAIISVSIASAIRYKNSQRSGTAAYQQPVKSDWQEKILVPDEFRQVVPLEWTPLIDLEKGIPPSVIERYKTEPEDIDLDSLRRNTDYIMQKGFEHVD